MAFLNTVLNCIIQRVRIQFKNLPLDTYNSIYFRNINCIVHLSTFSSFSSLSGCQDTFDRLLDYTKEKKFYHPMSFLSSFNRRIRTESKVSLKVNLTWKTFLHFSKLHSKSFLAHVYYSARLEQKLSSRHSNVN